MGNKNWEGGLQASVNLTFQASRAKRAYLKSAVCSTKIKRECMHVGFVGG